jgi:hypothetical protein
LCVGRGRVRWGFASALRSSGLEGTIISFEPVPSSYVLLQQRMGYDPLWSGHQYGLSDKSGTPRLFVKMDTQGHDVRVMMGATGVIDWIVGLQSELPAVQCYQGMPGMSEALQQYATYGFVPIGFYPVNTFHASQITPEFDVLFSRYDGSLTGH